MLSVAKYQNSKSDEKYHDMAADHNLFVAHTSQRGKHLDRQAEVLVLLIISTSTKHAENITFVITFVQGLS